MSDEQPPRPDPQAGDSPEPTDPWAPPPPLPPPAPSSRPAPPPDAWEVPINTGVPASLPPGAAPWEPYPDHLARARRLPTGPRPGWSLPDPAAVSGPPWPVLVASHGYTPPRLIRWPVVAAVAAVVVVYLIVLVALSSAGNSASQGAWRNQHATTINTLSRDEAILAADYSPSVGAAHRLADWRRFRIDVVTAAQLPNPGGSATAPWREMLNDYANASSDVVQAMAGSDPSEATDLADARRDLTAGVEAAHRFYQALGAGSS